MQTGDELVGGGGQWTERRSKSHTEVEMDTEPEAGMHEPCWKLIETASLISGEH